MLYHCRIYESSVKEKLKHKGINMAFMDFLFGKGAKTKTKPIFNPQQEAILNQLLGGLQQQLPQGLQNLQNILGGGEEDFAAFERPARRGFEQETLPTIAERFTGAFGPGSQRSSAFGQALGTAGRELEENLLAKRMGLQTDALSQLMSMLGPATSPRQYQYQQPRRTGFLESLLTSTAQGLGAGFTGGLGQSLGGKLGVKMGGSPL